MSAISVQLTQLVHKKKGKKRGEERNGSIEIEIKKRLSDEEQTGQSVPIGTFVQLRHRTLTVGEGKSVDNLINIICS